MFTNIAIAEEVPQTVESVVVVEEPTSGFLSFAQDSTLMNFAPLVLIFLIFPFSKTIPAPCKSYQCQAVVRRFSIISRILIIETTPNS